MNHRSRAYHIGWTGLMIVVIVVQTMITDLGPMPVFVAALAGWSIGLRWDRIWKSE